MVKTRRMVSQIVNNSPSNIRVKKNSISESIDKVRSKKIKTKNQCASIEDMMKLCRPLTILLKRPSSFEISNASVHTPIKKVEGKVLR